MPNIKSAIKRVLVNEKKAVANKSKKSELRTIVKKAKSSLEAPTAETASAVNLLVRPRPRAVERSVTAVGVVEASGSSTRRWPASVRLPRSRQAQAASLPA